MTAAVTGLTRHAGPPRAPGAGGHRPVVAARADATRRAAAPRRRPARGAHAEPSLEGAYRALAPAVVGYFRSHGAPDPEDLAGDVFVGVARGLHRFQGDDGALRRWVFTIAHRRLVDDVRKRVIRPESLVPEPPDVAAHDKPGAIDADLVDAVRGLTPLQREVVVLRFVADLPLRTVARIVRRRVGAVKALQNRALYQLAARLDAGPPGD
jgi:RNA polymerase sigma factor (sigma-70 family)